MKNVTYLLLPGNTFTLNDLNDNNINNSVSQELTKPNIQPQNILTYTISIEILEVINKEPNRKTPGYDLH